MEAERLLAKAIIDQSVIDLKRAVTDWRNHKRGIGVPKWAEAERNEAASYYMIRECVGFLAGKGSHREVSMMWFGVLNLDPLPMWAIRALLKRPMYGECGLRPKTDNREAEGWQSTQTRTPSSEL